MPAKAPIYLKATNAKTTNTNGRGGKKLREVLSTEMISLPLGDFRHTAHVGRGADDVFGDTTFLQQDPKTINNPDTVISRGSLRRRGKGNKKSRYDRDKADRRPLSNQSCDGYGPAESPTLQSAISLPMLNQPSSLSVAQTAPEPKPRKLVKTSLTPDNNSIGYNKAKSHETGLNCLSVSTAQSVERDGGTQCDASAEFKKKNRQRSLNSVGESEGSRSSTTLTEKTHVTSLVTSSTSGTSCADDPWTFDLDLGSSLLDEIMTVLDKSDP